MKTLHEAHRLADAIEKEIEECRLASCEEMVLEAVAILRQMPTLKPEPVPLTDEQLAKIAVEDEFLLYCDQDSFNEIARAIERAHGIGK